MELMLILIIAIFIPIIIAFIAAFITVIIVYGSIISPVKRFQYIKNIKRLSDYRFEYKAIRCDYETGDISVISPSGKENKRAIISLSKSDYGIEHKVIKCDYETGDVSNKRTVDLTKRT